MLKYTVLGLIVILVPLIIYFAETLNSYSPLVQAMATVILVVVTAYYAWVTREMQKIMRKQQELIGRQIQLMEKQVIADIRIGNASVYVGSTNQRLTFDLSFDVYNKNCASGSITLPNLILKYPDGSEETLSQDVVKKIFLGGYKSDMDETQVIFLNGGERKNNLKLKYYSDPGQRVCEKDNIRFVDFYVKYSDNLDNNYEVKADRERNLTIGL